MKHLLTSLALALSLNAMADTTKNNYEINIKKGQMHCQSCVNHVKKALSALPEIEKDSVKVTLEKSKAEIKIKEGKAVNIDAIKTALHDAGYDVTSVEALK